MPSTVDWLYFRQRLPGAVAYAVDRVGMQWLFTSTNVIYSEQAGGRWICRDSTARQQQIGLIEIAGQFEASGTLELAPELRQKPLPPFKCLEETIVISPRPPASAPPEQNKAEEEEPTTHVVTPRSGEASTEHMLLPADLMENTVDLLLGIHASLPASKRNALQALVVRVVGSRAEYRAARQRLNKPS